MRFCETNRRNFRAIKFIVTDHNNKPMFWGGEQFVYSSSRLTSKAPTELFSKEDATRLIRMEKSYRILNNFSVPEHKLIPVFI